MFGHVSRPVDDDGIEMVNGKVMLVAGTMADGAAKSGLRPRKCRI